MVFILVSQSSLYGTKHTLHYSASSSVFHPFRLTILSSSLSLALWWKIKSSAEGLVYPWEDDQLDGHQDVQDDGAQGVLRWEDCRSCQSVVKC